MMLRLFMSGTSEATAAARTITGLRAAAWGRCARRATLFWRDSILTSGLATERWAEMGRSEKMFCARGSQADGCVRVCLVLECPGKAARERL